MTSIFYGSAASCYEKLGDMDQTWRFASDALYVYPDLLHPRRSMVLSLQGQGNSDKALEEVKSLLSLKNCPQIAKEWPVYLFHQDDKWWGKIEKIKEEIEAKLQDENATVAAANQSDEQD